MRGAGVGAGRAHPGADLVDEVLDAGAVRVEVHPRRRDALLVEALAGPVVRRVRAGAVRHRAGRGHPEGHLVGTAVGVDEQVARRLVGAGEPGPDHHRRGAGGERERHVARVAYSPVGPDVPAELPGRGRALEHRGELRPADAGHHPGRAHRARPDADLDDVGARLDQLAHALGGHDVAGDDGHRGSSARTARSASTIRSWCPCAVSTTRQSARPRRGRRPWPSRRRSPRRRPRPAGRPAASTAGW